MASPLEITLILCDHAVADPTGKVHMLGAGWSVTSTPTAPSAVVVMVKVPWDRANQKITPLLQLLNQDGAAVKLVSPDGSETVISQELPFEVGRPPGHTHGSPIDASMALNVGPMPLAPGRYEWRLEWDQGESRSASFEVRSVS